MIHWRLNSAEFWIWQHGRLWHLKNRLAAASCSSLSGEIFRPYVQSINNQECARCAFGIPAMPVLNPFNSREPQSVCLGRGVENPHTAKAVGSRHLCFKSQHSYYGFHVACKVLCICFGQSLLGMPSHIKMLGIHPLRTNNPCKARFLKDDIAVEDSGLICCGNHF